MSDDGLTSSITDFLEPSLNKGNEENYCCSSSKRVVGFSLVVA